MHLLQLLPPEAYPDVPTSSLTTRFVASTQNKTRCPVFCTRFAPDSRRVLTGDSAGGISVWNTQDFGYMQYLQVGAAATPCACQRRACQHSPAVAVVAPHPIPAKSGQGRVSPDSSASNMREVFPLTAPYAFMCSPGVLHPYLVASACPLHSRAPKNFSSNVSCEFNG